MKKRIVITSLLFVSLLSVSFASAHNPFITKPEKQHTAPAPVIKSKLFLKILIWQQELREKMTQLVHQAKDSGSMQPLIVLVIATLAYGTIHAAGPGHGKAIAFSYILSQRPTLFQAILFGNALALFHGASGIIFVLMVRVILKQAIVKNLENVTHVTQIVSFSLVLCLGLFIFIKGLIKLMKRKSDVSQNAPPKHPKKVAGPLVWALLVGWIPCPGVVMVMLFALSMDLIFLGIVLGVTISVGMALTITVVVIVAMSGKVVSLSLVSRHSNIAALVECSIETIAGLALATLGFLFLGANI